MKVTLRTKPLANGSESIFLDIYDNGKRKYEYLRLYLVPETDNNARRMNANAMKKANELKAQYILGTYKPETDNHKTVTLMTWFDTYCKYMKETRQASESFCQKTLLVRSVLLGYLTHIRKKNMPIDAFGRNEVLGFLSFMRNWK